MNTSETKSIKKISVIGGGPGGLYFSLLTKKRIPEIEIEIFEQNKINDAFGFGVVFSDETLSEFLQYDLRSYDLIRNSFSYWDNLDIVRNNERVRIKGNGFCGCSRKTLLSLLQQRCKEEGISMNFETQIKSLENFSDSDLIVASDGINSFTRQGLQKEFGTNITLKSNRFVWCGSTKPLDAFTYFFKSTPYGAICAHTYQYEKGKSTWIFECSNETFLKMGLEIADEKATLDMMGKLYKEELDGHPLISNRSHWRQFPHVENKNWNYNNIVLIGDAKATAHYSIGSGTKLAMECAIALSDAIVENPSNVLDVCKSYDKKRRNTVEMIQHAALVSLDWFEGIDRHMQLDFDSFAFSVMSRSKKITIENQARRDKEYASSIIRAFNRSNKIQNLDTPTAFTPYSIGNLTLKNRIVMSPMGQYCAKNGLVNDWHFVHYGSRAIGGIGLIIAEMTAISPEGRITEGCAGLWNEEQANAWRTVVDFVHQNSSSKIGIQLGHSGRKGAAKLVVGRGFEPIQNHKQTLLSASPIAYQEGYGTPKEMTENDMKSITEQFVFAAVRAKNVGFDLIEIQAHHGFLLATFLSPLTNIRTDHYGGTIEHRASFPLKVIKAVRDAVGSDFPLSVRLSATDWHTNGISKEDVLVVASKLKEIGVNIINVSTGNTVPNQHPHYGRMWQSPFAEWIRNSVPIPTITAGSITTIDQVNTLLLNKRADLVALGRPLLINANWVREAMAYEQYSSDDLLQTYINKPYFNGVVALYSEMKKSRDEFEKMKEDLKPTSHQNS